jgi:predicted DNA-binding protein YlxM (UPF0122 family)
MPKLNADNRNLLPIASRYRPQTTKYWTDMNRKASLRHIANRLNMELRETLSLSEIAALFGLPESAVRDRLARRVATQDYFSISDLAKRWRCSRGTVYNRLRSEGARVLDFATPGKRGKKVVAASVVLQIESRVTKRLC